MLQPHPTILKLLTSPKQITARKTPYLTLEQPDYLEINSLSSAYGPRRSYTPNKRPGRYSAGERQ